MKSRTANVPHQQQCANTNFVCMAVITIVLAGLFFLYLPPSVQGVKAGLTSYYYYHILWRLTSQQSNTHTRTSATRAKSMQTCCGMQVAAKSYKMSQAVAATG